MGYRLHPEETTILDAASSTGAGTVMNVEDFRHIIVSVATDGGGDANFTLQFQASIADNKPDFDSSQSVTNMWDYVQVKDLQNGSSINGDTGLSKSGADDYRLFEVNTNGLTWFTANLTERSQGEVTVKSKRYTNT